MPADADLITLVTSAMQAFGRWIEDIASGTADAWKAQDFRDASDALRLNQTLVALTLTGSAVPAALTQEAPAAELGAATESGAVH
jgi:chemosensory pili system protein ChpA (sensor histidine kinase/response regulator)